ncbi:ArsR/SmtB family transcription factor [Fictibacillus terranigra]|uniref:Helix-turn-helix domain-containing protein n=1 Tax=Fictibacillus terranigra TaxID=3058424 RepID=A0ABT8E7H0_9BACL|nr:helix-turn-helix domain-containing protein [Fictibacillus sp. CENA-BCM004]MDN4073852.1 helix-turn-helix domain-containing protein [Fictibacillus sp. CENA-BCM004]
MKKKASIEETYLVTLPEQAAALLHPIRSELLSALKEPASATEIAKQLNETPQKINYHLKALEKVGLVFRAGTRNVRNLVEVLYQAVAKTLIFSDSLGLSPEASQKLKDQHALAHVLSLTETMKKDALQLMERAEDQQIPSAVLQSTVSLSNEEERNQFINEYFSLLQQLVGKYQSGKKEQGEDFQVSIAVYPKPEGGIEG